MKGGFFLDIVVREGATVLELFTGEDQALLVRGDSFLVLNLGLDVVNGVGGFDLKGDSLSCQGLDKDLHSTAETEDQVKSRFLLDVTAEVSNMCSSWAEKGLGSLVAQGATVFKLLSSEDEALLVGRDALFVLDFGLDIVDCVRRLDFEGDGLSGKSLNEDLHAGLRRREVVEDVVVADKER